MINLIKRLAIAGDTMKKRINDQTVIDPIEPIPFINLTVSISLISHIQSYMAKLAQVMANWLQFFF